MGYNDGTVRYWRGRDLTFSNTRGSNQRTSKLSEDQVRDIKSRPHTQSVKSIAVEFNVGSTTIQNIRTGKTWGHIK